MDVKTILGLTSAIVGTGVIIGQDPSFENPGVQPILTSGTQQAGNAPTSQDKRVTVRFKQASAEEILDWLSNQGVSFVTTGIPKGVKVDLNVSNVPLAEVIDIIGEAIGGSFVKRGNTYVFQKGPRAMFEMGATRSFVQMPTAQLMPVRELEGMPMRINAPDFMVFDLQDPKSPEEVRALRERMLKEFGPDSDFMKKLHRELGDSKKWESFGKDMEKQFGPGSAFEKNMKVHGQQDAKKWEAFGKEMEKKFGPGSDFAKQFGPGSKFEKDMKVWGEKHGQDMEKQFGPGSKFEKDMKVWGEKYGKEMEKKFGPGSDFEKQFGPGSKFEKEMRALELKNGTMRELSQKEREQMMKNLEKHMKDMKMNVVVPPIPPMPPMPKMDGHAFVMPPMPQMPAMPHGNFSTNAFQGSDILDIAKNLSPSQREKNKKQGFLYWSDLTKDQQTKLGMRNWTGNWTVSYNKDGESFTLKSDRK